MRFRSGHPDLTGSAAIRSALFLFVLLTGSLLLLSSCGTTIPEPRYTAPPKRTPSVLPPTRPVLPEGWADITVRSRLPQVKLWLINRDYSGTMVLRELQADPTTQKMLAGEGIELLAVLSLRSKIPEQDPDYRVTRVPAVIDRKRNFVSYAYTEKGLLRRVVVFRKKEAVLELELMQEQSTAEFDAMTTDLVMFAEMLFDR